MATPTGAYMNWSTVSFVYGTSPTTVTLTRITNVDFDKGVSTKKFSGDIDQYPSVSVNDFYDPSATVAGANIKAFQSIPDGTEGTLTAVLNDARNGATATGGALQFIMSQAKKEDDKFGGRHRDYGEATVKFGCRSTDGVTNPVAVSFL